MIKSIWVISMRIWLIVLLSISVSALSSTMISFDSEEGLSLLYRTGEYELRVGYKYSGFGYENSFENFHFGFETSLNIFDEVFKQFFYYGVELKPFKIDLGLSLSAENFENPSGGLDFVTFSRFEKDMIKAGLGLNFRIKKLEGSSGNVIITNPLPGERLGLQPIFGVSFKQWELLISYKLGVFGVSGNPIIDLKGFKVMVSFSPSF